MNKTVTDRLKISLIICSTLLSSKIYSQCSFTGLDPTYCIDDASSTLTGTPDGGAFSGPGMTGAVFDPSDAGAGVHTITYTTPGDSGDRYYLKSIIGNPWGSTTNNAAMTTAFGADWTLDSFEAATPATIFSPTTSFVFLDGSDGHATELNTFLIANLTLIEDWVNDGGSVLINSAPNEGGDINFGFGATTLNYASFEGTVNAVDATHPAFLGPSLPTSTTMTGTWYSHARILGVGYTNVLVNGADVVLCEKAWGAGTVMVGGMTTTNWHSPAPNVANFRANLFVYLDDLASAAGCVATQEVEVFDLPVVTAAVDDDEICIGESVIFNGGGADTYVWDLGVTDGVSFTPIATGTETYTVIGTNTTTGCDNTAMVDLTVHELPVVTAAVDDDEICLGESAIFNGGGADTYVWDMGVTDGVAFTPVASGTETYTVTGTNTTTGCTNTASVDLTVHDLPVVTAAVDDDEICLGESVIFNGGGADTYTWDMGVTDGVAFTPVASGTETYTVTGTNTTTGCTNTATVDLTVHDLPVVTAAVDDDEICIGESVIFNGGGADTYTWDMGVTDGVAFTPVASGTETYTVTGTNTTTGCTNTASVDLTVHDLPVVTAAVDDDEICLGESVIFNGGGADTYTWDMGVTDGVAFTPVASGTETYTVTGTNTTTGCTNTASVDLTVHDLPVVTAAVDDDEICLGESVIFNGGGADTYTWDMGVTDGVAFTPVASGTETYTVTGTNTATGCTNTATVDLTVHDLPVVTAAVDDDEICLGESVIFNGGGADTYTWDMGVTDGVAFTPVTSGTETYTVTGTNTTTGCTNTASVDLTVHDLPVVTASASATEICLGESVVFNGGGADTYLWDLGVIDGVAFTPVTDGTVTYTVTGTDAATGCENTATIDVTVYDNPIVTAIASPDEICIGESVTFTGGGAEVYAWDGGVVDGLPFTPIAAGTFTYTVIGSVGASGCENTATVDITVHELPTVAAAVDPVEICLGESATFNGAGADTYLWDLGVTDDVAFTPITAGTETYTVTGTDATTGCENTATVDLTVHALPLVTAAVDPVEICIGESVVFNGGGADTYSWDWGVTDDVAFTPGGTGTETYTVTGTEVATGCENTATVDLTVHDLPAVTATVDPLEICLGESATFNGGGADSYVWDLGVTDDVAFTPLDIGTTTYTVTGTNAATGCENTATVDLTVHDLPAVTATVDATEICIGESVTFNGGGADAYSWDMGVTNDVAFTPATIGVTTYTVTGTNAAGCENTATVDVTVHDLPVVTASASETEICLGESVIFTGGGAATYTWDMGVTDGLAFTPATAGTHTFSVTGTSAAGCTAMAMVEVTVVECEDVIAEFFMDNNICVGECVEMVDSSLGTMATWEWDFGGGADPGTSGDQHPTVCFNTAGTYDIQLTVTNINGTSSTVINTITVNEYPNLSAELDTIIELGGKATLIASTTSSGVYSWTPDDDVYCPECPITEASPREETIYYVVFTDQNGCSTEDSVRVLVNFVEGVGVPTGFSPNGDGYNDVLYVKSYSIASMEFTVYNRFGEEVFKSDDQNIGWDGTYRNREENPGVFTWVLHYNLVTGRSGMLKGNTTLIR